MKLDGDDEVGELGRLSSLLPECKCLDLTLADGRRPRERPSMNDVLTELG